VTATDFVRGWSAQAGGVVRALVEPPTVEPLTVPEGKLRAGLDWPDGDPRDQLMAEFIAAARGQVEHDTGLALLQQTWHVWFGVADPWTRVPIPSQTLPAQSITYPTPPPDAADLVLTLAQSYPWATVPEAPVLNWLTLPWVDTSVDPVVIVAGWPTPAALKQEAPGLYHAVALLTAHYATLGRDLATVGDLAYKTEARLMPMGYDAAIQPYRCLWLT
jgi:uncharacterized phiE125 gp8 family phage protein